LRDVGLGKQFNGMQRIVVASGREHKFYWVAQAVHDCVDFCVEAAS
jgi:hypothetical protein